MRPPAHYGFNNNNNDSNNNGFAVKTHMAWESTVGEYVKAIYFRLYFDTLLSSFQQKWFATGDH